MSINALKNHKADKTIGEAENARNKKAKKNPRVPFSTQLLPDVDIDLRVACATHKKSHYEIIERGIELALAELKQ